MDEFGSIWDSLTDYMSPLAIEMEWFYDYEPDYYVY